MQLTIYPTNANGLQSGKHDERDSTAGVIVKELKHKESSLQWKPDTEEIFHLGQLIMSTVSTAGDSILSAFPVETRSIQETRITVTQNSTYLSDHEQTNKEGYKRDDQEKQFTSVTGEEIGWIHIWYGCDQAFKAHKLWRRGDMFFWGRMRWSHGSIVWNCNRNRNTMGAE